MTDEDKCAAVDVLLTLYGGWGPLSGMLGKQSNPVSHARAAYQARCNARVKAVPHIEDVKLRWRMSWMPAFWDTIQEDP